MMADKYCTEYRKPLGKGPIFCSMMAALQEKWADAEALGDTKAYMKYLGAITGHWCGTAYRKETYRCRALMKMEKAVPTKLKWSPARKRFLQLTKDVAKHYCKQHGHKDVFCPLLGGLAEHYFEAVNNRNAAKFKKFVSHMHKAYCTGNKSGKGYPTDGRCSIFPYLERAVPQDP
jgi:hypothetical protein